MNENKNTQQGFTLIELMITMVVFMIAVVGLVGMQKASVSAAQQAKHQTTAYNIARFVTAQLKTEFANWRKLEAETIGDTDFPLIRAVLANVDGGGNVVYNWLPYNNGSETYRLDELLGHSALGDAPGAARYCVSFMVQPMANTNNPDLNLTLPDLTVWRTRVRVTWTKEGYFAPIGSVAWNVCTDDAVSARLGQGVDNVVELVGTATRELAR